MATANLKLVQRLYDAFATGDMETMLGSASPDIVLEQDSALPWGGRYVGADGIAEFFLNLIGTSDTGVTTEAMFEAGDRVIQCGRSRGTVHSNGATYDIPECHVWTIEGDKVTRVEFFIDTPTMLEVLAR